MPRIPDIPGELVSGEQLDYLKSEVARLCGLERYRFPGSQPISFGKKDLTKLESEDYWVCEKSDGVRVLVFVHQEDNTTQVFLIDRHDHYRAVTGYYFPFHEDIRRPLGHTLLDGELVIDIDPHTHRETLRLLIFDCLVHNEQNIMAKPLSSRYGRLQQWFYEPYEKVLRDVPSLRENRPFDIKIKRMELSYHVEKVLREDIPRLQHGNDGLIYTCAESGYVVGTDERILKWKPPSENSIDFRLELRFPPLAANLTQPDMCAKPQFVLNVWLGKDRSGARDAKGKQREAYEFFDVMSVDDDEWTRMKTSGEQIDDRVVEVCWDALREGWRMMRFRDDKPEGNHRSTVEKIVQSIMDGIEQDELIARSASVKTSWKERQGRPKPAQRPPLPQAHSLQPGYQQQKAPPPGPPRPYGPLEPAMLNKVQGPLVWLGVKR
ncbi:mRNA capping enzyme [Hysterangium stoloniferum]|nr:mRNA capping enzyme [Hysterangium stoloniferum]